MPAAVFEPATAASKQPQTYALDRAVTGIGRDSIPGPSIPLLVAILTYCEDIHEILRRPRNTFGTNCLYSGP
jgi:hypothetical protein